ncbi:MAG TPA: M23 family peptidase, partial [Pseudomonadales bacterium]|nr:M23 family peptidase [Pseudomonadales bacterium]
MSVVIPAFALPENAPVPGGVAVIEVPADATSASFHGNPVMLLNDAGKRYAVIGIPLSTVPGTAQFTVGGNVHHFDVQPKAYKTQRLTITNKR